MVFISFNECPQPFTDVRVIIPLPLMLSVPLSNDTFTFSSDVSPDAIAGTSDSSVRSFSGESSSKSSVSVCSSENASSLPFSEESPYSSFTPSVNSVAHDMPADCITMIPASISAISFLFIRTSPSYNNHFFSVQYFTFLYKKFLFTKRVN